MKDRAHQKSENSTRKTDKICNILVKFIRTANVISIDTPCKDAIPDLQR